MANTDGIEVEVLKPESYKKICDLWAKEHNLC